MKQELRFKVPKVDLIRIPFDRVADIYDKTRGLPPNVMEKVVEAFTNELKGYKTLLDVGVGTGRFAKPLQEKGFNVFGIDISRGMTRKAKEKEVNNLLLGDACNLPFKDLSFDATVSNHVLHLIVEWKAAFKEIVRVTKNILVSTTYTSPNPLHQAYEKLLEKRGYTMGKRGISEAQLKSFVEPTKSMLAVTNIAVSADKTLTMFQEKATSSQWDVPDRLHRSVMEELRARFAGKTYYRDIEILVWRTKNLRDYLTSNI